MGSQPAECRLDNLFISFDGIDKNTYTKHRVNSNYEKTFINISKVLEYRKQLNKPVPRFEIRMIDFNQSDEEKKCFLNRKHWQDLLFKTDAISFKPLESFAGSVKELNFIKKYYCNFLNSRIAIMWNGDLTTCCYDCHGKNIIGNVCEDSIQNIFLSNKYMELRKLYLEGKLQKKKLFLCHTCLDEHYTAKR